MMVDPSGDTSSDIHVPSVVVNDTVRAVCSGRALPPPPAPPRLVAAESCAGTADAASIPKASAVAATVAEPRRREQACTVIRGRREGRGRIKSRYTTAVDQPRYLIPALWEAQWVTAPRPIAACGPDFGSVSL